MNRDEFWQIIDRTRNAVGSADSVLDGDLFIESLEERLSTLGVEQIVSFKQHVHDLLADAYRWDLWAAAFIVNGGCSDDGFCYFRCWLIANGRERFAAVTNNPTVIGNWADPVESQLEDLMYAPVNAHGNVTGGDFPWDAIHDNTPDDPVGTQWDENDLRELFPDLFDRYAPKPKEPPTPCPHCGEPLRTTKAKQCFVCGKDWH